MSRPKIDTTFADLRHTLDEARKSLPEDNIIDAPEHKSRKERRRKIRNYDLPKDRRCPDCGQIKLKSRQWVIKDGIVTCLGCWRKIYS